VLKSPRPELRRITCEVLGKLGSSAANGSLLVALEDTDASVAEAARKALSTIRGVEVPRDRALARSVVGSS
jgi:hypothetical protein